MSAPWVRRLGCGAGRAGGFYSRSDLACRTTLAWSGRLQCKNCGDAGGARRAGRSRTPSPSVADSWRGFSNNFPKINLQLKYLESIILTANCFLLFMKFPFIISNTHLYLMNAVSCSIIDIAILHLLEESQVIHLVYIRLNFSQLGNRPPTNS